MHAKTRESSRKITCEKTHIKNDWVSTLNEVNKERAEKNINRALIMVMKSNMSETGTNNFSGDHGAADNHTLLLT